MLFLSITLSTLKSTFVRLKFSIANSNMILLSRNLVYLKKSLKNRHRKIIRFLSWPMFMKKKHRFNFVWDKLMTSKICYYHVLSWDRLRWVNTTFLMPLLTRIYSNFCIIYKITKQLWNITLNQLKFSQGFHLNILTLG